MRTGDGRARPGISQANSGLRKVLYPSGPRSRLGPVNAKNDLGFSVSPL